jgi:hypothetical protein
MRFFVGRPERLLSAFVALSRGFEEISPVPQDRPESTAQALARLELSTKTRLPPHGRDEKPAARRKTRSLVSRENRSLIRGGTHA